MPDYEDPDSDYREDDDGHEIYDPEDYRPEGPGFIPPEEMEGIA